MIVFDCFMFAFGICGLSYSM